MTEPVSFGEWLRKKRREMDLSRQQLADQVGCAEITLRRIEMGELKPSKELAAILLDKVGVPPDERERWVRFARGLADFPLGEPSAGDASPRTNLPFSVTSFLGREKELNEITRLAGSHRIVSLVGIGGIGKTRLAIRVGELLLADYPDGVWLIELGLMMTPELIPQTIASVLGVPPTRTTSITEALVRFLRAKRTLLILDNCEHLLDFAAQVANTLLGGSPGLKILTTSREALRISGEVSYSIPPLSLTPPEQSLNGRRESNSSHLFVERARLTKPDFVPTEEDSLLAARICSRLDGIPLALELAAAQTYWLSLAEIADQLDKSFEILVGGSRTAPTRLQSIRASLEWSWGLLSENERIVMYRLSVFSGSWTIQSAQMICSDAAVSSSMVKFSIGQLVRKSLVNVREIPGRETRYTFHEIVRQYAREKRMESGDTAPLAQEHLDYFISLAETAEAKLHGSEEKVWLDRLRDELPDLRAALEYGFEVNSEKALRLASALGWFWFRCGLLNEGHQWLDRVLMAVQPVRAQWHTLPPERVSSLQKGLNAAGQIAHFQGDYTLARTLAEESLTIAQVLEDTAGIADALSLIGIGSIWRGDMPGARQNLLESVRLFRDLGATWQLASTLNDLGFLFLVQREYEAARPVFEESLHLAREAGDNWTMGKSLANLGTLVTQGGDLEQGRELLEESLEIAQALPDAVVVSWVTKELGHIATQSGDYKRATELYNAVLAECRATGFPNGEAEMLRALGQVALYTGDRAAAESLLRESLAVYTQIEDHNVVYCLLSFAHLAELNKDWPLAVTLLSIMDAQLSAIGISMSPLEKTRFDWLMEHARTEMDETNFKTVWEKKRRMPLRRVLRALITENADSLISE